MKWWQKLLSFKEPKRPAPERTGPTRKSTCPVDGCQIAQPHSHLDALLKQIRGK